MEKGWQPQAQLGDGRVYQRPAKHVQSRDPGTLRLQWIPASAGMTVRRKN